MGDSNFSKTNWRKTNVEFLKSVPGLWRDLKFVGGYLEMVGDSGLEMCELLAPANPKEQFIGVDCEPRVIWAHRKAPRTFRTVLWDAYAVALHVSEEPGNYPITVFNFDTTNAAGNTSWWQGSGNSRNHGADLLSIFGNCRRRGLATTFILNHCVDVRGKPTPTEVLRDHRNEFLTWANMTWANPKQCDALRDLTFRAASDFSWTGWEGPFQVYRSETDTAKDGGTLRMVTLRFYIGSDSKLRLYTPNNR